jgi:hypothetical protein
MTIIFIHLYFLIEFEILFYLYYIMPYEKALIYRLFDVSKYTDIQNKTYLVDYIEGELDCVKSQQRLDKYNYKLWIQCMAFLGALNAILAGVFARDIIRVRQQYAASYGTLSQHNSRTALVESDYKKNDDTDIEMVVLGSPTSKVNNGLGPESFSLYYWNNSKFVKNTGKTVRFMILVGIFEYAFFTLIVDKYKIVNTTTLLCKMAEE